MLFLVFLFHVSFSEVLPNISEVLPNILNQYAEALQYQNTTELEIILSENFTIAQCNGTEITKAELLARISKIDAEINIRNWKVLKIEALDDSTTSFTVNVENLAETVFYERNDVITSEKNINCKNLDYFTSSIVDDKSIALNIAQNVMNRYKNGLISKQLIPNVISNTFNILNCYGTDITAQSFVEILQSFGKVHLNEVEILFLDASFIVDGLLSFDVMIDNITENQYSARWDEQTKKYVLVHEYHTRCLTEPVPNTTSLIDDEMIAWDLARSTVDKLLESTEMLSKMRFEEIVDTEVWYTDCQNVSSKNTLDEFWNLAKNTLYNQSISYTQVMNVTYDFGGKMKGFTFRALFEKLESDIGVRISDGKYRIYSMTFSSCPKHRPFFEQLDMVWREQMMTKAETVLFKYINSIRERNGEQFREVTQNPFVIEWNNLSNTFHFEKVGNDSKVFDMYPAQIPMIKVSSLNQMDDGTLLFTANGEGVDNVYRMMIENGTCLIMSEKRNKKEHFIENMSL